MSKAEESVCLVGLLSVYPMMPLSAPGHTNIQNLWEVRLGMYNHSEPGEKRRLLVTILQDQQMVELRRNYFYHPLGSEIEVMLVFYSYYTLPESAELFH